VFFGESIHTLDDKGRVFVPKRFLEDLSRGADGSLVAFLTRGQDACLYLFSETGFQRAVAELSTSVFSGEDARGVIRAFFANAARVDLDASGRVLIPEKLRAGAGLEKDVVIVGVGDRAEIWSRKVWTPYEAANLAKLDHIDRVIAGERTKIAVSERVARETAPKPERGGGRS